MILLANFTVVSDVKNCKIIYKILKELKLFGIIDKLTYEYVSFEKQVIRR